MFRHNHQNSIPFVNEDLNTIKSIVLQTVHENYMELSSEPYETSHTISISEQFSSFFSKSEENIKLEKDLFNAKNYGNLFFGKAKHFFTGNEGVNRLKKFFEQTRNCRSASEFLYVAAQYYCSEITKSNFEKTLELAFAKLAKIKLQDGSFIYLSDEKNFNEAIFLLKNSFPNYDDKSIPFAIGECLLKQIQNNLPISQDTLQQAFFRMDQEIYDGSKALLKSVDDVRSAMAAASVY